MKNLQRLNEIARPVRIAMLILLVSLSLAELFTLSIAKALVCILINLMLCYVSVTDMLDGKIYTRDVAIILALSIASHFLTTMPIAERLVAMVLVFAVCFLCMFVTAKISKTKALNVLGMGDVRLLSVSGFLLGFSVIYSIMLSCIMELVFVFINKRRQGAKVTGDIHVRFGPYIALPVAFFLYGIMLS